MLNRRLFRWFASRAIRAWYGRRAITVAGECGVPFAFRPSEYPTLLRGYRRVDPDIRAHWTALLRPDEVIYDVGANIGFTVQRYFAVLGGACRVVAFEPMPRNLELLRQNTAKLPADCVTIVPSALGDTDGTVTFADNVHHGALSRMSATRDAADADWPLYWEKFAEVTVPVARLDTWSTTASDPPPTFLKVDVEGAGALVLAGARETLTQHRPALYAEFHDDAERNGMQTTLAALGYETVRLNEAGRLAWAPPLPNAGYFLHPQDPRLPHLGLTPP